VRELDLGGSLNNTVSASPKAVGSLSKERAKGQATERWWLHILLLGLTLLTTTVFGFALEQSFRTRTAFDVNFIFEAYSRLFHGDLAICSGFKFSLPLLTILVAHELGHYIGCRIWRVEASLPFFLPSPTLLGTFGAFILVRSPFYRRRALFDIGVSGPIAGFIALLPFLLIGIAKSRIVPGIGVHAPFTFGMPILMRFVEAICFPGVPITSLALHPMAMAAWAGLLATALNLLPIGQLDGGHIIYAMAGERWHRFVSTLAVAVLFALGFLYWPWWFWAFVMYLFGRRHRLVYDATPLSRVRIAIGCVAAVLLILSISIVPVRTS
jgi:membrane-associated protease RseP (regulator of RpoE activity)